MKTFSKIAAAFVLTAALTPIALFAQTGNQNATNGNTATSAPGGTTTVTSTAKATTSRVSHGRKGGYVHATTYTTKTGKVVHRKGGYRHSTRVHSTTMKMGAPGGTSTTSTTTTTKM